MRTSLRSFCNIFLLLILGGQVSAQLTGTVNVPGTYADLTAAIAALNAQGVGAGGVIINITGTQVAPTGGYRLGSATLNASVSASKTITINGNKNTVSAFSGGTGYADGVFFIEGTDYVTIDGLYIAENAGNTTATTMMEWGYALLKRQNTGSFDGCQNITIKNCNITLKNTNAYPFAAGVYMANHIYGDTTSLAATATGDVNSNNTFSGDTLRNVRNGFYLKGYANSSGTIYDQNNVVGGATVATGNVIWNYGGATAVANTYGVFLDNQNNVTVQNNNINNMAASGVANMGMLYGIFHRAQKSTFTASGNIIQLVVGTGNIPCGVYSEAGGAGTITINNNTLQNFATPAVGCIGYDGSLILQAGVPRTLNIIGNKFLNDSGIRTTLGYMYIYGVNFRPDVSNVVCDITFSNNLFDNFSRRSTSNGIMRAYYVNGNRQVSGKHTISGNTFTNCYIESGSFTAIMQESDALTQEFTITNNSVYNCSANKGNVNGILIDAGDTLTISGNNIYALTTLSSSVDYGGSITALKFGKNSVTNDPWGSPNFSGTKTFCYKNNISNLQAGGTQVTSGNSPTLYGIRTMGGFNCVYNNFIIDLRSAVTFNLYSNIVAIDAYGDGGGKFTNIWYNTIYIGGSSGLSGVGVTGILYQQNDSMTNVRYNIINLNATAGSGNSVACMRRSGSTTSTAGVAPPKTFVPNNNIYYAPPGANNFLYVEGGPTLPLKNGYAVSGLTANTTNNIVNDPGFNTGCSLYKAFLGDRDSLSYTEDNLFPIGVTGTYAPSGTSFAESSGKPITSPNVADDYAGTVRGTTPDRGALQFTGAPASTPPVIGYTTPAPLTTYCTSTSVTVSANITASGGVNTTSGTAPRLYYKKSTEANAFGNYPGNNNSAFNGWKYVEATGTAPNFNFTIDYSKLNSAIVAGDSITYFVIAQDNATVPNVSTNAAGFISGCYLPGVNLNPSVGSTTTTPASRGYRILTLPASLTATASRNVFCSNSAAYLSMQPTLPGSVSLQWQHDNNTGTWSDISSATNPSYTSPVLTGNDNFRVQVRCGSGSIATSSVASIVIVPSPSVLSTTPGSRCGTGTATLSATSTANTKLVWYDVATGGNWLDTGKNFTTPIVTGNTTFYVAAFAGVVNASAGKPARSSTNYGSLLKKALVFDAFTAFTLHSVYIYPIGNNPGSVTVELQNSAGTVLQTRTINNVLATSTGTKTLLPLNFSVPVGAGYRLALNGVTGSITNVGYDLQAASSFPTTLGGILSITSGGNIASLPDDQWAYFYDWLISAGCESSPRTAVNVNTTTAIPVTATASPASLCGDGNTQLSATSANSNYTYQWQPGSMNGASVATHVTATTQYIVKATDNTNNCAAYDTVDVTVNPAPVSSFLATGATTFCKGDSVELDAAGGGVSYQWRRNGVDIPGATSPILIAKDSGAYTVVVSNGICSRESAPITINVSSNLHPTIQVSGNTMGVAGGPYATYQWNLDGKPIPGATASTYTANGSGVYTVTVSNGTGCKATSPPINLGIAQLQAGDMAVRVYPNPASTIINIASAGPVNVSVCGMDGKEIIRANGQSIIDMRQLADGLYMLRITDKEGMLIKTEKLVKAAQ